jgi:hypothetical protein
MRAALKVSNEAVKVAEVKSAEARRWKPTKATGLGKVGFTSRTLGTEAGEVKARGGAAYAYEYGAKRHVIVPTRKSGNKALKFGPKQFATYAPHPGFRGRPFWEGGMRLAEPAVIKAMEGAVVNAMRRTFR